VSLPQYPGTVLHGYLGDIGVPPVDAPMDFAGWFEAYIGGSWYTFDPATTSLASVGY
jgi:transglutaminase-like putative cysteine protease